MNYHQPPAPRRRVYVQKVKQGPGVLKIAAGVVLGLVIFVCLPAACGILIIVPLLATSTSVDRQGSEPASGESDVDFGTFDDLNVYRVAADKIEAELDNRAREEWGLSVGDSKLSGWEQHLKEAFAGLPEYFRTELADYGLTATAVTDRNIYQRLNTWASACSADELKQMHQVLSANVRRHYDDVFNAPYGAYSYAWGPFVRAEKEKARKRNESRG